VTTLNARPKAISYLRFSSAKQREGDSYRRQWEAAQKYAQDHNLDLDHELKFHDMSMPGFRGANAERGKLAAFRRAVEDGIVPAGSYLLVEDFDRLSRMDPWDAFPIFQEILRRGISIVTLRDGKVWSNHTMRGDLLRFMEPLFSMWNAHNENVKKGERVAAKFAEKRKALVEGRTLDKPYKRGPAWLQWNASMKQFEHLPERAFVVADIFAKADAGWSLDRIARDLNTRKVPPWEYGSRTAKFWRGARLRKMLTNRAAIGTLVMRKTEHDPDTKKRSDKIVGTIEGHFPPVVERELFERVNARLATTAPRGRNATRTVTSLVAGLAKCARCGGSVVRVSKGEYVYLVCSRAHAKAGCVYQAVHYHEVESALRLNANSLIEEAPRGEATEQIESEIVGLDVHIGNLKDDVRELLRELRQVRSPTIGEALREAERAIEREEAKLQKLRERRERLGTPFVAKRLATLRDELTRAEFDAAATNRALKAAVERIVLNPEIGCLELHWRDSDAVSQVPVWSRHLTVFNDEEAPQTS
jgi:DNA invertase Pin-like site-specific DNA recombinase